MVSHELASIFGIADRVIMLDREVRGIIAEGAPHQLEEKTGDVRVREFLNRRLEPVGQKEGEPA